MKVIAIGDPHFRVENVKEVDIFIQKILELISRENPDFVVVLGDVLHTHERIHTIPLNKAYEFIKGISQLTKVYVLVGNHDFIQNQQFLTTNHWMNGMKEWKNVTIVDTVIESEDKKFLFCPYTPNGRFLEALTLSSIPFASKLAIFAHQEFMGCKMGAIDSIDGDVWDPSYPQIISGHIHSNQRPQPNIYYPGSSMQIAFGESENNIIPIFEFDHDRLLQMKEIDLGMTRKKIVYKDVSDVSSYVIPSSDEAEVKLTIQGTKEELKAFQKSDTYKTILKTGTKVVLKPSVDMILSDQISSSSSKEDHRYDFPSILRNLILQEKNALLYRQYESLINGNTVGEDELIIF